MRRRDVLTGVVGGIALLAGCERPTPDPELHAEEPRLDQGAETTVEIRAANVGALQITDRPASDVVEVVVADAELSAEPDRVDDADSPVWRFDDPVGTLVVTLPVSVASGAEAGQYEYEVTAWNDADPEVADVISERYAITVDPV